MPTQQSRPIPVQTDLTKLYLFLTRFLFKPKSTHSIKWVPIQCNTNPSTNLYKRLVAEHSLLYKMMITMTRSMQLSMQRSMQIVCNSIYVARYITKIDTVVATYSREECQVRSGSSNHVHSYINLPMLE